MIKYIFLIFTLAASITSSSAQTLLPAEEKIFKIPVSSTYTVTDLANYIKQHYSTDTGRIRAVYIWITNNINYDIAKLKALNINTQSPRQTVFEVLQSRNAVCQGYADLFIEICNELDIKSTFIGGYTKRDGIVNTLPHAWVSVEIENSWYFFDPTWGAGYVKNGQFYRNASFRFYKLLPEDMIKDHMPFDPMYQFLNQTVTNKEFIEGRVNTKMAKPFFNYSDTLKHFATLTPAGKLISEARRLEANGISNDLILTRLNFLKKANEPIAFNEANLTLKQSIDLFNRYISLKNKQFTSIEDEDVQVLIDSVSLLANQSRTLLYQVTPRDYNQRQVVFNMSQHLEKFQSRIVKEKEFVARYITAIKSARSQLFSGKKKFY